MLESLISFKEINDRPYIMAVWSFIICTIAVLISSQIPLSVPGTNTGFLTVLFIIIPSVYFITSLIKREERMEEQMVNHHTGKFWERHGKDIFILLFFFAGLTAAFAVWSLALPQSFFGAQITKINEIQTVSGQLTGQVTGNALGVDAFNRILYNNLQVMLFSFVFSFIFGAGAIFIICWNASVLGVYVGQLSKFIWNIPLVSLYFLPHGLFEIGGYVVAGLAGGLISAAVIRKNKTHILKVIIFDCMKLLALAVVLVVIGAGLEVWLA